jgi:uncharacterized membrane protein
LSCLAAIQAPIIMMSQNRQEEKDRIHAENDYRINQKAEKEIRELHLKVDQIQQQIHGLSEILEYPMNLSTGEHSSKEGASQGQDQA